MVPPAGPRRRIGLSGWYLMWCGSGLSRLVGDDRAVVAVVASAVAPGVALRAEPPVIRLVLSSCLNGPTRSKKMGQGRNFHMLLHLSA